MSLHGGPTGFDYVTWQQIPLSHSKLFSKTELEHFSGPTEEDPDSSFALFMYTSPDGDQGFPGVLRVETLMALIPGNEDNGEWIMGNVIIVYRAKLENEETVTPVNLTQHWGFNLDASLKDRMQPSVKQHTMSMKVCSSASFNSACFCGAHATSRLHTGPSSTAMLSLQESLSASRMTVTIF